LICACQNQIGNGSKANNWLFRSFEYFNQSPALVLAQGPSFRDAHHVTDVTIVVFVVGHELLGHFHGLAIEWVLKAALNFYADGLRHFVADYDPNP
jgi:hypothetical protein